MTDVVGSLRVVEVEGETVAEGDASLDSEKASQSGELDTLSLTESNSLVGCGASQEVAAGESGEIVEVAVSYGDTCG